MNHLARIIAAILLLAANTAGAVAASYVSEEWTMPSEPGQLAGTLLVPGDDGPWPVVLILAGSGPTDRDGNSTQFPGGNNSLRQLAEALAADGIASLRVDKRGVGASASAGVSEFDLRFEHYIDDARAWCERLQADPRFRSMTVVGHSQGAQVGMNAAWMSGADGFVSLCGPGQGFIDLLREQLKTSLPVRTRVRAEEVMQELEMERVFPEPPVELTILFRPSVQEFLISWHRHNPLVEIARLPLPLLIVQGTTDSQVSVADAERLAAARPGAQLLVVEGMNHVLKMVAAGNNFAQQSSLVDSTLVIAAAVPAAVTELVREAEAMVMARQAARAQVQARARRGERLMTTALEDSVLAAEFADATGEKVGRWARRFAAATDVKYLFGPKPGGYVAEGDVVSDRSQDCVSLLYRIGELARARSAENAVDWALRTRFAGAGPDVVTDAAGRLDYDSPAHLDFSLDMIRTGMWGRDVTAQLSGAVPDTVGSSRYPADSFTYLPTANLDTAGFTEGDIVWFVLDPEHESGAKLRQEYGLVIGHIGIIVLEEGQPWLIHAASSDLEGWYEGGTVVSVPLLEYLARVDKFAGVMVTRY